MKTQKIRTRLLLPALVVFLLLPPLSCLIFQWAARQYAYTEAAQDLERLQQNLLPIMASCFSNAPNIDKPESNSEETEAIQPENEPSGDENADSQNSVTRTPQAPRSKTVRPRTDSTTPAVPKRSGGNTTPATIQTPTAHPNPERQNTTDTETDDITDEQDTTSGNSTDQAAPETPRIRSDIESRPRPSSPRVNEAQTSGTERPRRITPRTDGTDTPRPRRLPETGRADNETVPSETDTETSQPNAEKALPEFQLLSIAQPSETESASDSEDAYSETAPSPTSLVQVQSFLRQVSALMRQFGGNAELIILESRMQVVYPRSEQEREDIAPLAADISAYIESNGFAVENGSIDFTASNGTSYLLNIYEVPTKSQRIKYLAAYCRADEIGVWVRDAGILVLVISFFFVIAAFLIFGLTAYSITRPLHSLCREAERIGGGKFYGIEPAFSLAELEELRIAMNRMSDQLERSDRQQRDFFQNVSHDLRNPLMSISGYAQGIEQGVFRSPEEAAHTILEESNRLTELVNRLLTLSRLGTMQPGSEMGTIRIAAPLEDCIDRFYGLAMKNKITLALSSMDEELSVCGEEELLGQALDNLLSNAIRYAKTTVFVEAIREQENIRITVADDGNGIAPKDLPHVFERSYKGEGGNYGIGLAIAQTAVQKMNGELTAANRPEGGAIFTMQFKTHVYYD